MNELDRWIAEYRPLSEPLTEEEIMRLKKRILKKSRPKRKSYRLILILAAAVCLLAACGAVAIGLFDSMTDVNQTNKMIEKYSMTLENPPSATVDGHTVTVQAILRSDNVARVIYDITGSERELANYLRTRDSEGRIVLRIRMLTNDQPSGHIDENALSDYKNQVRQSASIGKVPGTNSIRYFADLDLTDDTDTVSIYVVSQENGAEVLQIDLPEPIAEKELSPSDAALTVTADGDEINCQLQKIRITPFRLILEGTYESPSQSSPSDADWNSLIHLYGANGKEIRIGKDGDFFTASGYNGDDDFSIELGSYDLLDPEEVKEIEIGEARYPVE